MKPSHRKPLVSVACLLASGLVSASAQVLTGTGLGDRHEERIAPTTLPPFQPMHWIFPNEIDPHQRKYLYFEGHVAPSATGLPTSIQIQFDWYLDPADPSGQTPQLSPVVTVPVNPSGGDVFADWWINICPPWVSLHLTSDQPIEIQGVFVHQCIPEPSQYAVVAGLGAVVFGLARKRLRA